MASRVRVRVNELRGFILRLTVSSFVGIDDNSPSKPTDFVHIPTGGSVLGSDHNLGADDASNTNIARRAVIGSRHPISSNVAASGAGKQADATFLTEASFGVAHDVLVQVITDTQPFEPYWEELSSIDLSDKNIESVARLNEFLPQLRTLIMYVRREGINLTMLANVATVIPTSWPG